MKRDIKVGMDVYVDSHFYISHGSDDVVGGLAKIKKIYKDISAGEECLFIEVVEHPGNGYNWGQILSKEQENLKNKFGNKRAYPDPDINTPWIEEGDLVDGKTYHGKPVW